MGVAAHLKIQIDEYDARIRTFVPTYDELLSTTAETLRLLQEPSPSIVDLGIGTGALAARCLNVHPNAQIVGIDSDPAMLEFAQNRLAGNRSVSLLKGDFLQVPLPFSDAIVASIALHHITTTDAKKAFYKKCHAALRPGGFFVSGDCFPAHEPHLAGVQRMSWLRHLEKTYSPHEAAAHLASWAEEDTYFPLRDESEWLQEAGFVTEVVWRAGAFAVILATRPHP